MSSWRAHGMRAWLMQRLTAIYIGVYFLSMLVVLSMSPFQDYDAWRQFMSHPVINIASHFFFLAVLYHAWIGARDVIIDYIPNFTLRISVLLAFTLFVIAMGIWVFMILLAVVVL